jgi:hypothetical protein
LLFIGSGIVAIKIVSQEQTPAAPPAQALSSRPAVAGFSGPIKFSDDTLVEVLGIQDDPQADPGRWWLPDGSQIPAPRFPKGGPTNVGGFGTRNIRFIIRMGGPPIGDKNLKVVVTPRQSDSVSVSLDRGAYLMNLLVAIPNSSNTANLKIGLGTGPWTESVLYDAATARTTNAATVPVRIGSITEEKGRTIVQVSETPQPDAQQDQGIVLLANGKRIAAGQVSRSWLSGATYTFDCPKAQMNQILFRSRAFEFIEMKNVSLAPTAQPIDVQIIRAGLPTTAP